MNLVIFQLQNCGLTLINNFNVLFLEIVPLFDIDQIVVYVF